MSESEAIELLEVNRKKTKLNSVAAAFDCLPNGIIHSDTGPSLSNVGIRDLNDVVIYSNLFF